MNMYSLETLVRGNEVIPYCICYNIKNLKGFIYYQNNNDDLIINFLNTIVLLVNKDTELYSCNINFDGFLIIDSLTKKKIRFEWYVRDLSIYWIEVYFLNIKIKIRCSYKLIPISTKNIEDGLELTKLNFPYAFAKLENLNYVGVCPPVEYFTNITKEGYFSLKNSNTVFNFKEVAIRYCYKKLDILYDFLQNIIKIIFEYDKNILKTSFSFSAIAYKIYKKKFDKFLICSKNLDIREYTYIKNSYFGGRCEVFGNPQKGEVVHYFDFFGMYAQCMKNLFPIGVGVFKTKNLNLNEIGLHTVRIFSELEYPILPVRHNKKLFFANGCFIGTFTHIELNYFLENGGVVREHYSSYVFSNEGRVFENYESEFTKIRKRGAYYNLFGKVMNNGLYGSFALGIEEEETVIIFSEEELNNYLKNTNVLSWKKLNNCILVKIVKDALLKKFINKNKKNLPKVRRNLIYASYISAYARIKLYEGFKAVIKNGGRLYYCDTDSIYAGFSEKKLDTRMGDIIWSKIYDDAVFILPKFYYLLDGFKEKFTTKGVSSEKHSFAVVKKKFYEDDNGLTFHNQVNFNKKDYKLVLQFFEKRIALNSYDKRIFSTDKKTSTPVKLGV